jgi:hypothetical protein
VRYTKNPLPPNLEWKSYTEDSVSSLVERVINNRYRRHCTIDAHLDEIGGKLSQDYPAPSFKSGIESATLTASPHSVGPRTPFPLPHCTIDAHLDEIGEQPSQQRIPQFEIGSPIRLPFLIPIAPQVRRALPPPPSTPCSLLFLSLLSSLHPALLHCAAQPTSYRQQTPLSSPAPFFRRDLSASRTSPSSCPSAPYPS